MEKIKSAEDLAREIEAEQLQVVRESLKKIAEIKNPRDMWFALRDTFNLLTMIIAGKPV